MFYCFTSNTWKTLRIKLEVLMELKDMARYAVLLLAPAEGFGLRPRLFCPSGKKRAYYTVLAYFCYFWCPVVTLVTFSSNLREGFN